MGAVVLAASPVAASEPVADAFDDAVMIDRDTTQFASRTTTAAAVARPDFTYTPCPEVTDSIYRLYTAYFSRVPEQGGFDFWTSEYSVGNWSLPRMSTFFSESPEFVSLYGSVSDEQFVELIYVNIFGRQADQGGRDYWLNRMANEGLDRGTVMLNFSESPEYIEQTETWTPLAGFFNWYPEATEWYCGFDNVEAAIPAGPTHADYLFYNADRSSIEITISHLSDGVWLSLDPQVLEPGRLYGYFAVPYVDGTFDAIRVEATGAFGWTMVFAPEVIPNVRAGWTAV